MVLWLADKRVEKKIRGLVGRDEVGWPTMIKVTSLCGGAIKKARLTMHVPRLLLHLF